MCRVFTSLVSNQQLILSKKLLMKYQLKTQLTALLFIFTGLQMTSCTDTRYKSNASNDTIINKSSDMNSYLSLFEIPASDISRAANFYQLVLDVKIEIMEMPEMKMAILPYENQIITAVITEAEGYTPSAEGVTVYLNAGNNLQGILDKVEKNGGKILMPKTQHADESGYFALFLDSEGNKMGLHSPN